MNCYPIINQVPALSLDRPLPQRLRAPLWPEMAFAAQTNVPAFYCLYNTAKNKRKKISQLWHFSHRRQTRNISMRKSPKIVSIVGFLLSLPSLSPTLLPSLSVPQSIPASFHFNWDGNFLRTKRIPRNQREPNGERARSGDGAPRKPTKKNQQRRQWANGSIGVSEICANNYQA